LRVLIVTPTYQEADNITVFLQQLVAQCPEADVLVVDDGSPDGTADLVDAVTVQHPRVTVMRRTSKDGLGAAYRAGFAVGLEGPQQYDALVHIDADLSHPVEMVPQLVQALADGAEVAVASRYVRGGEVVGWPWYRRLLSGWGNAYSRAVLGVPMRDVTAGFRAYSIDALRRIDPLATTAEGYVFHTEMSVRSSDQHLRIVELPLRFVDRQYGSSKMSGRIITESMLTVTKMGLGRRWRRLRRSR